ncbi:uncharacterized protein METZ01_LOCUS68968, partial [marine metagenome]
MLSLVAAVIIDIRFLCVFRYLRCLNDLDNSFAAQTFQ